MSKIYLGVDKKTPFRDLVDVALHEIKLRMGSPRRMRLKSLSLELILDSRDFNEKIERIEITFPKNKGITKEQFEEPVQKYFKDKCQIGATNGRLRVQYVANPQEISKEQIALDIKNILGAYQSFLPYSDSWLISGEGFRTRALQIVRLLNDMLETDASDLHLEVGRPPLARIDGELKERDYYEELSTLEIEGLIKSLVSDEEFKLFQEEKNCSFGYQCPNVANARISAFGKRGSVGVAIRLIPEKIPTFEQLHIPPMISELAEEHRGLILVTGATGSGKSTTLAAIIQHINETRHHHVITIEDPIEFIFHSVKCIVSQRQVGPDVHSFNDGLVAALRQDPDIIMIGEMRDKKTVEAGMSAAETGHLVLSTLHTKTAVETLSRLLSFFEGAERDQVRQQLSQNLIGVICQRLIPKIGGGRVPALEVLKGKTNQTVKDAILGTVKKDESGNEKSYDIRDIAGVIENATDMMSFDQAIVKLQTSGMISMDTALTSASDPGAVQRILSGISYRAAST